MKKCHSNQPFFGQTFGLVFCLLFALTACDRAAQPDKNTSQAATLSIDQAWIRAAPPNSSAMAGYFTINNPTADKLTLISATSPQFGAIEFHETVTRDGNSRMIRHKSLTIAAQDVMTLQPGGKHLMLFRAAPQPNEGDVVIINLAMRSDAGQAIRHRVEFEVKRDQTP